MGAGPAAALLGSGNGQDGVGPRLQAFRAAASLTGHHPQAAQAGGGAPGGAGRGKVEARAAEREGTSGRPQQLHGPTPECVGYAGGAQDTPCATLLPCSCKTKCRREQPGWVIGPLVAQVHGQHSSRRQIPPPAPLKHGHGSAWGAPAHSLTGSPARSASVAPRGAPAAAASCSAPPSPVTTSGAAMEAGASAGPAAASAGSAAQAGDPGRPSGRPPLPRSLPPSSANSSRASSPGRGGLSAQASLHTLSMNRVAQYRREAGCL